MNPGGTPGGKGEFLGGIGLVLAGLALYLFFDSVQMTAGGAGFVSGLMGAGQGGWWDTGSRGIIFVPFLLAIIALFYNSDYWWAWVLLWVGLGIIVIEILSRLRFVFNMKTSYFMILLVLFGAGVGLIVRSFRNAETPSDEKPKKQEPPRS
jgi:uncharacterized protein